MRIRPFLFFIAFASLTACSGTAIGTAGDGGTSGGTSRGPSSSTGTEEPGPALTPGMPTDGTIGTANPGPSQYDPLFEAPTNKTTTPNAITGVWAGSTYSADVRLKIGTGSILIATRCGSAAAVGLEVSANVSFSSIKTLASKSTGSEASSCGIKVTPQEIPHCTTTKDIGCFDLNGTTLTFNGIALFSSGGSIPQSDFTKLSD